MNEYSSISGAENKYENMTAMKTLLKLERKLDIKLRQHTKHNSIVRGQMSNHIN